MDNKFIVDNMPLMYFILNKYKTKFPNTEMYEDFKENFMVKYIRSCKQYNPTLGIKFSGYLTKVVNNYYLEYINRRKGTNVYNLLTSESLDFEFNDGSVSVRKEASCDYILSKVTLNLIFNYIDYNFTQRQKYIFNEYFLKDTSQQTLAKSMNCSQASVSREIKNMQNIIKSNFDLVV